MTKVKLRSRTEKLKCLLLLLAPARPANEDVRIGLRVARPISVVARNVIEDMAHGQRRFSVRSFGALWSNSGKLRVGLSRAFW